MENIQLYKFFYRGMLCGAGPLSDQNIILKNAVENQLIPPFYDPTVVLAEEYNGTQTEAEELTSLALKKDLINLAEEAFIKEMPNLALTVPHKDPESNDHKQQLELDSMVLPAYTSNTVSIEDLRKIFKPQINSGHGVLEFLLTERLVPGIPVTQMHRQPISSYSTIDENLEVIWIQLRDCKFEGVNGGVVPNFKRC
jgi:hypothetical protein